MARTFRNTCTLILLGILDIFVKKFRKKNPALPPLSPAKNAKLWFLSCLISSTDRLDNDIIFCSRSDEEEKLHRCLACLSNLSRRINFMSIWVAKGLLNKFDSHARQRCNFSVSNLAFPVLHKLRLWHRIYHFFPFFSSFY